MPGPLSFYTLRWIEIIAIEKWLNFGVLRVIIAGRSVVGIAVGAGSFAAPLYISELSPAPFRGRLMTLNVLFITVGQVVAYVVGWLFVQWGNENTAWRWIVGLGAAPAGIQSK